MSSVAVRIFHPEPRLHAGPLERTLADARLALARRHEAAFGRVGARDVEIVSGPPNGTTFGARLRAVVASERPEGIVVLGSGGLALATDADLRLFVETASRGNRVALANNRYSADAIAVSCAESLLTLRDLRSDNALPRWLEEVAGYEVRDLARRWRLQIDLDSPLDVALIGQGNENLGRVAAVAADPRAELLVAGRTSATAMRWLEQHVAARVRVLAEERGLKTSRATQRPPRSVLGLVLDHDGPEAFGSIVAGLADAALVDSRVLMAHRFGPDEAAWPPPEDRFGSDLLQPDSIADPWLRTLTESARSAPIPIVLGGHTLVGPGVRLALRPR
jgi:hypothetical protein